MKKTIFIFITLQTLLTIDLNAQPTLEWARTYNNAYNTNDAATDIKVDRNGNVYVMGSSTIPSHSLDLTTIKYNSSGIQQWIQTFNSNDSAIDRTIGLVLDTAGNIYVTGYCGYNFGPYNIELIKYNTAGTQQWVKYFDGGGNDQVTDIKIDRNNFIILGGVTQVQGGDYATLILKYNSDGDTVWVRKTYQSGTNRSINSIVLDSNNNIYGCGSVIHSSPFETGDFLALKYSPDGTQQWLTTYNSGGYIYEVGRQIAVDGSGISYMTGITEFNLAGNILTVKFNQSGNVEWAKTYNSIYNGYDFGEFIKVERSGNNIYVSGASLGSSFSDILTIKYNYLGDTLWTRRFNGTADYSDSPADMIIDDSSNVYVTGTSTWSIVGFESTTLKYDQFGNLKWVTGYVGPNNTSNNAAKIILDNNQNFYVCGFVFYGGTSQTDLLTLKYSQLNIVNPISSRLPEHFSLFQNYPNPFNPKSNIKFQIAKSGDVKLTVFDVLGREVAVLVNKELYPGTYEVEFDGSNYPSGVYFYKLDAGDFTQTKKMVLIK